MAQLGNIAESFLDGFGCLGSVIEPCVRPGSRENLIDDTCYRPARLPELETRSPALVRRRLIGYFLAALLSLTSYLALFVWPHSSVWVIRLNGIIAIALASQFVRELVEHILMIQRNHWRQHAGTGEKAAHRV